MGLEMFLEGWKGATDCDWVTCFTIKDHAWKMMVFWRFIFKRWRDLKAALVSWANRARHDVGLDKWLHESGRCSISTLKTSTEELRLMWEPRGSQWGETRRGLTWEYYGRLNTRHAAMSWIIGGGLTPQAGSLSARSCILLVLRWQVPHLEVELHILTNKTRPSSCESTRLGNMG